MFDFGFMIASVTSLWALGHAAWSVAAGVRTLQRSGYTGGGAAMVIVAILVLAACVCAALLWTMGGPLAAANDGSSGTLVPALVVAFALGVCVLTPVITHAVPSRGQPRSAPRPLRLPLHLACYAGAAAIAVYVVHGLASQPGAIDSALFDLPLPLAGMVALILVGRRVRQQITTPRRLQAVVTADLRPPVLYLREFEREREPFVESDTSQMMFALQTLEDFIGKAVEQELGPFVALGGPQDYLQPLGAAREYVGDLDWKPRFESLARQARAIVLHPGSSEQLGWEVASVLRAGLARKLFVLVGPATFGGSLMDSLRWRMAGRQRQPRWPEFHAAMEGAGYRLSLGVLPDSALIVFDDEGRGKVMPCTFSPSAYVVAMQDHLDPPTRPQRFPYQ